MTSGRYSYPSSYPTPTRHISLPRAADMAQQTAALMARAGITLSDWQMDMLSDWSAVGEDGKFVHKRCGGSIPRQVGKSFVAVPWGATLAAALGMKVLYTAHNYSTTCEMLRRFRKIFGRKPDDPTAENPAFNAMVRSVDNKTAQEAIFLANGGSIHFSTRTKSATLGYSFDVVIYDEAQELTDEQQQAVLPTTAAGAAHNPQSIFIGTPPRAHGIGGEVFEGMREDAIAGGEAASDLCWWEWSVDEVGDITDEERWYEVNPSLGRTADVTAIRMASRSMTPLAFAQEYLGYWLPKGHLVRLIKEADWEACRTDDPPMDGKVAYGIKFSVEGAEAALAVAIVPQEGKPHVELIDVFDLSGGMDEIVRWVAQREDRASVAMIDGKGGSETFRDKLSAYEVSRAYVPEVKTATYTAACSYLNDALKAHAVTWFGGDEALGDSVAVTTSRKIGSSGAFGFGGEDPLPVDAVALALYGAVNSKRDPNRVQEVW